MTIRSLVLKPLAGAALLCTGAAFAASPTNGFTGALPGANGASNLPTANLLNLNVTLTSLSNQLPAFADGPDDPNDSALNPFAQGSYLHHNHVGKQVFNTANDVRRAAPKGLIPVNSKRPDLPGLRKDATSRLVHDLKLYETFERVLDGVPDGRR